MCSTYTNIDPSLLARGVYGRIPQQTHAPPPSQPSSPLVPRGLAGPFPGGVPRLLAAAHPGGDPSVGARPLNFEWIDVPERWRELRGVWDDAVAASGCPSIFATFDFLESCWTHFARPNRNELAVLALWDDGRLAGFAPLRLSTRRPYGIPLRTLAMLSDWESDRAGVAFPAGKEKDCTVAMLRFLGERKRRWDVLKLRELAPDGGVALGLGEWCPQQEDLTLLREDASPSPFVPMEGLTWDEYLSRLGARTRKNVKRYLHHLEARGGYALETFDRAEDMGRALDLYLAIEGRSWKRRAGQGIGKDARNEGFYRDLMPRLARRGRTSISFLRLRDRHIAALIEHSMNGVVYAPETTFDDEMALLSPGATLQALCLKRRMEPRCARVRVVRHVPEGQAPVDEPRPSQPRFRRRAAGRPPQQDRVRGEGNPPAVPRRGGAGVGSPTLMRALTRADSAGSLPPPVGFAGCGHHA